MGIFVRQVRSAGEADLSNIKKSVTHGTWWTLGLSTSKTLIMRFLSLNTLGTVRGKILYDERNLFLPVMI